MLISDNGRQAIIETNDALGLASIFTLVATQDATICRNKVSQCYGGILPDGGSPPGTSLEDEQLFAQICSAVATAGPCLDGISGECRTDAAVAKLVYSRLCMLDYQEFIQAIQCSDMAMTSGNYQQCVDPIQQQFESSIGADNCGYFIGIVSCTNTSLEQLCGSSAAVVASLLTELTVLIGRELSDSIGYDYSNCPLLANGDAPSTAPDGSNDPPSAGNTCNDVINTCYGNIQLESLVDESLPTSSRVAIFESICSTDAGARSCLAGFSGDASCLSEVGLSLVVHDYICANSFQDVLNGYTCIANAGSPDEIECDGLPDYDGHSDQAAFQCRYYQIYLACLGEALDQSCDQGAEFAKGFFAIHTAVGIAPYVSEDCPLLEPIQSHMLGISGINIPTAPPSQNTCELQLNACYQNYDISLLNDETLPTSVRQVLWEGFCRIQADSGDCVSGIRANLDCLKSIEYTQVVYGYACSKTYEEVLGAVDCNQRSRSAISLGNGCALPAYDGISDIADFQCRYTTQRKSCIITNLARTCNPDYLPTALDMLDMETAHNVRAHVYDDCPLLQPLKDILANTPVTDNSASVNGVVKSGVLLVAILAAALLT